MIVSNPLEISSWVYNEIPPEKSIQQLFQSFLQPLEKKESLTSSDISNERDA